jgi:hypothetical protein
LPRIYHRKEYEAGLVKLPDYRLTCFYVDKAYRRKGSRRLRCGARSISSHRQAVVSWRDTGAKSRRRRCRRRSCTAPRTRRACRRGGLIELDYGWVSSEDLEGVEVDMHRVGVAGEIGESPDLGRSERREERRRVLEARHSRG